MRHRILLMAFLLSVYASFSQKPESITDKSRRMAWWKEAKFGLFIHWGLYAVPAGEYAGQKNFGEWIMNEAKISIPEYEKFAPQFNPTQFNADTWVSLAKAAGMKYIVITSKHHDGFSMFDSKVSNYDIIDRTPFKRDPMRELADACRKHGLKLCFYHSIMDWHHPHENKQNFARYRDEYMYPQLRELLTQYGDIGVLWFDGEWIDEWTEDQGKDLYKYVRSIQPDIIINNRVGKGRNGMQGMNTTDDAAGDFGTPEQEILEEKNTLDWESCMTMNEHWGYNKHDLNYKAADELIWNLVDIVAKGGNFLLNIGPTAQGTFPPESIQRMETIAQWMAVNQKSVHGARTWTHWREGEDVRYCLGEKGVVYATFRGQEKQSLLLKKIRPGKGSKITMLGYNEPIAWEQTSEG
ncbi:MAG: alpha-L-fucosidase, partial [Saprospiraceae bacterium]|nr:alpha-L-fucosidase [Saprospiraceae bacterium]